MNILNDEEMVNEYANFYGHVEQEQMEDDEYAESYLLNDNFNECDAESLNDENLMLNNDELCAAYSENLNENIENNNHHSQAWNKVEEFLNDNSLHNIK